MGLAAALANAALTAAGSSVDWVKNSSTLTRVV
jgi:hypothetical protein